MVTSLWSTLYDTTTTIYQLINWLSQCACEIHFVPSPYLYLFGSYCHSNWYGISALCGIHKIWYLNIQEYMVYRCGYWYEINLYVYYLSYTIIIIFCKYYIQNWRWGFNQNNIFVQFKLMAWKGGLNFLSTLIQLDYLSWG